MFSLLLPATRLSKSHDFWSNLLAWSLCLHALFPASNRTIEQLNRNRGGVPVFHFFSIYFRVVRNGSFRRFAASCLDGTRYPVPVVLSGVDCALTLQWLGLFAFSFFFLGDKDTLLSTLDMALYRFRFSGLESSSVASKVRNNFFFVLRVHNDNLQFCLFLGCEFGVKWCEFG